MSKERDGGFKHTEVKKLKAAEPSASSGPSLMCRDALISHLSKRLGSVSSRHS